MIDTSKSLAALADRVLQAQCVALDTEFVWEQTYYPSLGIVQVGLPGEEPSLIDVPAIKDMAPLGRVLSDPKIVKILHDAQQDLTILRRATGCFPRNIFDTRTAAGFVGLSSSTSLAALTHEILHVQLPKTETRTNWLQRPLSSKQIEYAMDDVRYLPALYDELMAKATELDRQAWLTEELSRYNNPDLYTENDEKEQFRRIKGSGRLSPRKQSLLRELAMWREEEARRRNRPRPWVLSDECLVELAKRKPKSMPELGSIKGLGEKEKHRYGKMIFQAIEKGLNVPQDVLPQVPEPSRDDEGLSARVDLVLAYMKGKSMAQGIDHALIATRADITALVREGPVAKHEHHHILQGWRYEFLGKDLLMLLAGRLAVRLDSETGLPHPTNMNESTEELT